LREQFLIFFEKFSENNLIDFPFAPKTKMDIAPLVPITFGVLGFFLGTMSGNSSRDMTVFDEVHERPTVVTRESGPRPKNLGFFGLD